MSECKEHDDRTKCKEHGKHWKIEDIEDAFEYLMHPQRLDHFIKFTYGLMARVLISHGVTREQVFELAREVVQQKMVDAFRYISTYDPSHYRGKKCPYMNWVYTMVARAAVRKARGAIPRQLPPPPPLPPPQVVKIECAEARRYISLLTGAYKQAVELCDLKGLTRKEAADEAGCSVGAMKVRLHRAHQKLRALRDGDG
jgi:DNA-directed RNA polymerase specialized sigma24 family protein